MRKVIVLGGGSAGFLAAIALRTKMPDLEVRVVRSKEIGIIGVGEGSTVGLTGFLHKYLRIGHRKFFEIAQPTWKLGLRFLWGPREYFNYSFVNDQLTGSVPGLSRRKAFFCDGRMEHEHVVSSLMSHDRVFERLPDGNPGIHDSVAYHFENEKFVGFLEQLASMLGVVVVDETVAEVDQNEGGIAALRFQSGRIESTDLYVDCSGFAARLLGKVLEEPFVSFASSLACDRAVVGGWDRAAEPIRPYTTCETMTAGWCWQIEHEHRINRGYVYSSSFTSDDEAEREFRAANPKAGATRIVKFISGRYQRSWVKNVVAIGNACGFVEPLEATALGVIAVQSLLLADSLIDSGRDVQPTHRLLYNRHVAQFWDNIRGFLAVHYKFNARLETPFWRHCQSDTDLACARDIVEVYQENGPTTFWAPSLIDSANQFGLAGYFALLVGQQVPYRTKWRASDDELRIWNALREKHRMRGASGFTIGEALAAIRSPGWRWVEERPSANFSEGGQSQARRRA